MSYDFVIIGGGISGMTAASLLATQGASVALVEKAPRLAPTIEGFVRDGVFFNTGFHYTGGLEAGSILADVLEQAGVLEHLKVRPCQEDGYDLYIEAETGWEFQFCRGIDRLEQRLCDAFDDDRQGITTYFDLIRRCWSQDFRELVQNGFSVMAPLRDLARTTLGSFLRENITSARLRGILGCHRVLYGMAPDETSLLYHAMVAGSYYEGCVQFEGGGQALTAAFAKVLADRGVDVHCGRTVEAVELSDGAFDAVRTTCGARVVAKNCIATLHPKALLGLLGEGVLPPAYRRRLARLDETHSAFVLYGRSESALDGENVIVGHPEPMTAGAACPSRDGVVYVSRSHHPTLQGGVSAIVPATLDACGPMSASPPRQRPRGYIEWKSKTVSAIQQTILNPIAHRVRGFRVVDAATPLTFRDRTGNPGGGLYGVKHRVSDMPLAPRTRVAGLYLSGQALTAPGLFGAAMAAYVTVRKLAGSDG